MSSCSEMQRPKITASSHLIQYLCSKQNRVSDIHIYQSMWAELSGENFRSLLTWVFTPPAPPLSHTRPLRSIPLPAHLQFHPAPVKSLHARSNLKFLCMPNTCRFQPKPYPRFTLHASAARYGSEEVLFRPPHGANLHQKRFISEVAGFARPRDLPVRRCFSWFYFFIF